MRRSSFVSAVAALALLASGGAAVAASAAPNAGTHHAPAPVTRVRAFDDRPAVKLTWVNPAGRDVDHVVVRYRRGVIAPKHRHGSYEGHVVRIGHHATTATLTHLSRDTAFAVSIWVVSAHGLRSVSRHARFTTDGGHVGHGRYTARFVDASGQPLAGVVAYAEDVDADHEVTATSGRNGTVSFSLAAGEYFLGGDGERATGGSSDATGYVGRVVISTIRAGHVLRGGSLVLRAGGLVHVHVSDAQGRPASGVVPSLAPDPAYVASDQDDGDGFFDAYYSLAGGPRTDANGDTTMRGVPGGSPFRVCVDPLNGPENSTGPRFLAACSATSQLARVGHAVSNSTLVLHRHTGGTIRGVVRSRDRSGFARSYVELLQKHKVVASTTSLHGGAFRITGVPSGTYRVCTPGGTFSEAGRTGYLPGCDPKTVTVNGTHASRTSTIALRPGAAVAGTVTGPQGTPVAGANVQFSRSPLDSAYTDGNGHYIFKGLAPGRHNACVFTDNMLPSKVLPFGVRGNCGHSHDRVAAVTDRVRTGVDARLKSAGAVSGTVVDTTGRSVPYATVDAEPRDGEDTSAVADAHGRFRVIGLRSGSYRVCAALGDDFYSATISACHHGRVRVTVGRATTTRVAMPATSAVRVSVVDDAGRPVAGVDATVLGTCRNFCDPGTPVFPNRRTSVDASATTDGHGAVTLDDLRPGHYAVCAFGYYGTTKGGAPPTGYADRCSGSTFDVDVRAGRTSSTRLVLHQGGTVTGRITDAAGQPLQGALVHVEGSAADDLPTEDTEYGGLSGDPFDDDDGGAAAAPGYYSRTAANGTYTVRSVRAGRRLVCVDPTGAEGGASAGDYLSQCVGGTVGSTTQGTPVRVRSAATAEGVDLALTAGGTVTGHVTSHVSPGYTAVVLFRGQHYVRQVHPNSSFDFRIRRVVPGTYSVCVAAYGRSTAHGRCYNDAAWNPDTATGPASDATPIQITAGTLTPGIDIVVPI